MTIFNIYHVRIIHQESGEPAIFVLEEEPDWMFRDKYKAYGNLYYVYCEREYPMDLLIEIGRAIERKHQQTK